MNLLLDSAFKGTVILVAAWIGSLALRRASADLRHRIWLMAMLAVAALPLVLAIPQSTIPLAMRIVVPALVGGPQVVSSKMPWLVMIWAAGAGVVLTRLIAGILMVARITRSAVAADGVLYGVLYSERAAAPMTWGFLRPVMILPSYMAAWSAVERDSAIRHERAHIARRDWFWQTLAHAITAMFWFHPLIWLANIQLRREAEGAADDVVLASGVDASDYASLLVEVARRLRGLGTPSTAIPMVREPELATRVSSIIDPSRRRSGAGLWAKCAIALVAGTFIFGIALSRQVQAQSNDSKSKATQPKVLQKKEPGYTKEAEDAKIEGVVTLQVVITPEGTPSDIRVKKSLGGGLDQKAIEAVEQWRFQPATKDGKPVAVWATIEVNFHLK